MSNTSLSIAYVISLCVFYHLYITCIYRLLSSSVHYSSCNDVHFSQFILVDLYIFFSFFLPEMALTFINPFSTYFINFKYAQFLDVHRSFKCTNHCESTLVE